MQFQVPQFIEVEDKIFGPLTLKQFIYVAGGAGASAALWFYIPYGFLSILIIIPLMIFSLLLAFYKKNGKPFIDTVEAAFYYFLGSKLYIWKKEEKKAIKKITEERSPALLKVPKISESKLKDLSWSLDIRENLNPITKDK